METVITAEDKNVILQINDKFQIARNVIFKAEQCNFNLFGALNDQISQITGIDRASLNNFQLKKKHMSFEKWCEQNRKNTSSDTKPTVSYHRMRDLIVNGYLNDLTAPTVESIRHPMSVIYSEENLHKDMEINGFIWTRIPKTKKYIVVEKPEQVITKMRYLSLMKEYRESDRIFLYVDSIEYASCGTRDGNSLNFRGWAAVAPRIEFLEYTLPLQLNKICVEDFVKSIMEIVPKDVIVVVEPQTDEKVEEMTVPDINSIKSDMKLWLDLNMIPYDKLSHRADLYKLIQISKAQVRGQCKTYIKKLRAQGINVIERPALIACKVVDHTIKNVPMPPSKQQMDNILGQVSFQAWCDREKLLIAAENALYTEQLKLDIVIDGIVKAKQAGMVENELEDQIFDNEWVKKIIHQVSREQIAKLLKEEVISQ